MVDVNLSFEIATLGLELVGEVDLKFGEHGEVGLGFSLEQDSPGPVGAAGLGALKAI